MHTFGVPYLMLGIKGWLLMYVEFVKRGVKLSFLGSSDLVSRVLASWFLI
jgi:hypothetical protein